MTEIEELIARAIAAEWGYRDPGAWLHLAKAKKRLFCDAAKSVVATLERAGYVVVPPVEGKVT